MNIQMLNKYDFRKITLHIQTFLKFKDNQQKNLVHESTTK